MCKCANVCFIDAITILDGRTKIDMEKCRCCGRCAETCSKSAIIVKIAEDAIERSIERVEPLVDVKLE